MLSHLPQRCMPLHVPLCWRMSPLRLYPLCRSLLFRLRVCRSFYRHEGNVGDPILPFSIWELPYSTDTKAMGAPILPFSCELSVAYIRPGKRGMPISPTSVSSRIYPRPPRFHYAGHLWKSWSLARPQDHRVDFLECCAYC